MACVLTITVIISPYYVPVDNTENLYIYTYLGRYIMGNTR